MSEEIKGKVKFVARTLGIKLEEYGDKWFNPEGNVKDEKYINNGLVGKDVTLTMKDDSTFTFLNVEGQSQDKSTNSKTNMRSDDYWAYKFDYEKYKDQRVSRHGALNTAIELMKLSGYESATGSEEEALKDAIVLADKILSFVREDENEN